LGGNTERCGRKVHMEKVLSQGSRREETKRKKRRYRVQVFGPPPNDSRKGREKSIEQHRIYLNTKGGLK